MIATVRGLFETHLPVTDLERSLSFYRDRVGLDVARVIPERQAAFLWVGRQRLAMLGLWAAGSGPQRTTLHIAFATAIEAVIAAPQALAEAGIGTLDFDGRPTSEPVVIAWMPAVSVYFRDPDGHLLEYIAMLPDPANAEGIVAWSEWVRVHHAPRAESDRKAVAQPAPSGLFML